MFKIVKNDYIIEYTSADSHNGPDGRGGGIGVNSSCVWVKINEGKWFGTTVSSMHKVKTFVENYNGPKEEILAELIIGDYQWQKK